MEKDTRKLQPSEDGYEPVWSTREMAAGTETVQQHLIDPPHNQAPEYVNSLTVSACHRLHDRLHDEAGDTALFELLMSVGIETAR